MRPMAHGMCPMEDNKGGNSAAKEVCCQSLECFHLQSNLLTQWAQPPGQQTLWALVQQASAVKLTICPPLCTTALQDRGMLLRTVSSSVLSPHPRKIYNEPRQTAGTDHSSAAVHGQAAKRLRVQFDPPGPKRCRSASGRPGAWCSPATSKKFGTE